MQTLGTSSPQPAAGKPSAPDGLTPQATVQAAILNALPANLALLDAQGRIVAVNAAWRRFAADNGMASPDFGVGMNYIDLCEAAPTGEAPQVASAIRRVLAGRDHGFQIEYPCHSPERQRWFVMTVTPLNDPRVDGAVVMHVDVTALRDSEAKFRQMAESFADVFFLFELGSGRVLYVSPSYLPVWGNGCDSLYAAPDSWLQAIHPDDRDAARSEFTQGLAIGRFAFECRNTLPGRSVRWMEIRGYPVREGGEVVRIAAVAKDITGRKQTEQELRQIRLQFASVFTAAGDAMLTVDDEHRIVLCNPAAERMFGHTAATLRGQALRRLLPPRDDPGTAVRLHGTAAHGAAHPELLSADLTRGVRRNGQVFPVEASVSQDDKSRRWLHTVILRDITQRRRTEAAAAWLGRLQALCSAVSARLVQVQERAALLRDVCHIAVEIGGFDTAWIGEVDPVTGNGRLVACHGESHGDLEPMRLTAREGTADSAQPASRALCMQQVMVTAGSATEAARGCFPLTPDYRSDAVLTLLSGKPLAFDGAALPLLVDLASQLSRALARIARQHEASQLALRDPLTGLARRPLFIERLALQLRDAAAQGASLLVCVLELHRPGTPDDRPGQPAGDALLKQVADWLINQTGGASAWARLEGNRFAAALSSPEPGQDAGHPVEQILAALQGHAFGQRDAVFTVSAQAGVAVLPESGATAEGLLADAEAALRQARRGGERRLVFSRPMAVSAGAEPALAQPMRLALQRGEFVLHYQPAVDLVSGRVTGAEALLRWNDPHTGLVAPSRFIPALEQAGLMREVGLWVLRQALDDARRWRKAGSGPLRVAVNIAAQQWRHSAFIADVAQLVGGDAVEAGSLALEFTESLLMADVQHSIASLGALRAMGVATSVDDFGTGYSSLTCLSRLPLDTLKIDGCFVAAMTTGPEGLALVSTIVQLAHALKLAVVAEGVETPEQSRLLRLLGCEAMQGFVVGEAVDGETLAATYLRPAGRG